MADGLLCGPVSPLVLIIEDDSVTSDALATLLAGAGFKVLQAADGAEGVELAALYRPAVVLLDLDLPRMHGIEVGRRIRAASGSRAPAVIVVTGSDGLSAVEQAFTAGFDDLVIKPVDPPDLIRRVRKWSLRAAASETTSG